MRGPRRIWWDRMLPWQRIVLAVDVALAAVCLWLLLPPEMPEPEEAGRVELPEPPGPRAGPTVDSAPGPRPLLTAGRGGSNTVEAGGFMEEDPFSPSRDRPPVRWSPEGSSGQPAAAPADPAARLRGRARGFRLVATTVVAGNPEESHAMIEADPEVPGPELYRTGEAVGPFRLAAVEHDRAVLVAEGIRVTLELDSEGGGIG